MQYCRRDVVRVAVSALSFAALVGMAPAAHAVFYDTVQTVSGAVVGDAIVGSVNVTAFTVTFTSPATISGGIKTYNLSTADIQGGSVMTGVAAYNSSNVLVKGGINLGQYVVNDTASICFFGTAPTKTLFLSIPGFKLYNLGGTLQDSTSLVGKSLLIADTASVKLVDSSVPEPGAIAFGVTAGLFTLGLMARRSRAA